MNKYVKNIIITLLCLLIAWSIFVVIDFIRLKNASTNIQPLIVLNYKDYETNGRIGTIYKGIGYTVDYYQIENTFGSGTNIKLFDLIPILRIEAQ